MIAVATATLSATLAPQEAARADGLPSFGNKKDLRPARERGKVDKSLFEDGPEGLKQYDVKVGDGPICQVGDRAVVHFECKWKVRALDWVNVLVRAAMRYRSMTCHAISMSACGENRACAVQCQKVQYPGVLSWAPRLSILSRLGASAHH